MRGWGADGKSSAPHFVFTISTFYGIECFCTDGVSRGLENPQKVAKGLAIYEKWCIVCPVSEFPTNHHKSKGVITMKKKFAVDVFRTIAHTFEIEAETEEEAIDIAYKEAEDFDWSIEDMLTDDIEVEVYGEYDENGEVKGN